MSELTIDLKKDDLSKAITDAIATSIVGDIISRVLMGRGIDRSRIENEFDKAVSDAARHYFTEFLKNDIKFKNKCEEMIAKHLTDETIKKIIVALDKRFY